MCAVRVVSWNLWWRFGPWEARQQAIAALLEQLDADVVCAQEVWSAEDGPDQVQVLAERLGLHACRTPQRYYRGFSFGNAIFSRFPIEHHEAHQLPPLDGPGHRYALVARLDGPNGAIPVVCTHLDYRFDRSAVRQEQVAAVLGLVAAQRGEEDDFPVVLAGDFNAVPTSDEIRMITGERPPPVEGMILTDAWPQRGDGSGHTWCAANPHVEDSTWPERRLDYVFVTWPRPKPLGNVEAAFLAGVEPVGGVVPSDHYAVVVDLVGPVAPS